MLYAYEKLDLNRLRKTKIGSYRIEVSELASGQNFINNRLLWTGLFMGGLLGLLGVGYYFFPETISAIRNGTYPDVAKVQLKSNNSNLNLSSTAAETETLSQPKLSPTKIILSKNPVNTIENKSVEPVISQSIQLPLTSVVPAQSQNRPKPQLTPLLSQCEQYLQANYLTTGKNGNAFDCFQQVLAQIPNQVEAKRGLQQIETRYQDWIIAALRQEQYTQVHRYWERLQLVNPQSTLLTQIETDLQQKIALALSAKQVTQANRYLANLTKLNPNSSVLPIMKQNLVKVISTWVQQCDQHFQANRLTMGKSGNALECYQQVLTQVPNNQPAKIGLKNLEKRYKQLIEQALQQKKWSNARQYLMRLQKINPQSNQLSLLRQRLVKLEQPVVKIKPPVTVPPSTLNSSSPAAGSATDPAQETQPTYHPLPRASLPPSPPSSSKQCSDIFMQESLGVRLLTREQKQFKLQHCNK
ncbi:MAG: hypothetical protein HC877_02200 [Thioploca sp.]|nr:hypothetical protein [Thioploca sp.]